MSVTFGILHETIAGDRCDAGTFANESTVSTVREIIRLPIQQEVGRYNRSDTSVFECSYQIRAAQSASAV